MPLTSESQIRASSPLARPASYFCSFPRSLALTKLYDVSMKAITLFSQTCQRAPNIDGPNDAVKVPFHWRQPPSICHQPPRLHGHVNITPWHRACSFVILLQAGGTRARDRMLPNFLGGDGCQVHPLDSLAGIRLVLLLPRLWCHPFWSSST
ncbi:hypothetical protein GALMADRAFT_800794 [Galerina marginata CBS 339.88]|uniref:Uncharacterized protein n=1 Tax=Galerina marginata (strain CBS 339.88) TaxID=685588 RepID=A0A067SUM4_GALM3|nr:hypothetical protein GALMADRAFT_800794 [Galerina marginata CBS 339.88]